MRIYKPVGEITPPIEWMESGGFKIPSRFLQWDNPSDAPFIIQALRHEHSQHALKVRAFLQKKDYWNARFHKDYHMRHLLNAVKVIINHYRYISAPAE